MTLFRTLGLVPLADPLALLIGLPALLLHITSSYEFEARLGSYYGLIATTVFFLSVPRVMGRLCLGRYKPLAFAWALLLILLNPGPRFWFRTTEADRAALKVIDALPRQARVCAQTTMLPRIHYSPAASMFPECRTPDLMLLDLERDTWPQTEEEYRRSVLTALRDARWRVKSFDGRLLFLGPDGSPELTAQVANELAHRSGWAN